MMDRSQTQGTQHPPFGPYAPAQANGMASAGGVMGIVGFVLSWIPFAGILFGWVLGSWRRCSVGSGSPAARGLDEPGRGYRRTGADGILRPAAGRCGSMGSVR
jgi:hypothetical protein